ncbi:MAG: hypothetical protein AABY22_21825, partial [Nanoarchaeota archaeon]
SKGKSAFEKLRSEFVNNAVEFNNMTKDSAEHLFDMVSTFGCLTGDTEIYRCSSNQYKKNSLTIKEAFLYQEKDNFKSRKLKILSMHDNGYVKYNTINKIVYTGKKEVYYLRTNTGKTIKASANHRFLVNNSWREIRNIKVNDLILCSDLELQKRIYGTGIGTGNHKSCPTVYEKIEEIKYSGIRETYDIEMIGEPRNFIANGFVSHNSYGFNKSHSVEYSAISYWCAWLKLYYPQAFYYALLKNEKDSKSINDYIQDAKKNNVKINFPDINKSKADYVINDNNIYAGFSSITGIGNKVAEKIIINQPYISYEDFCLKTKISKKLLCGLIISDAFRNFNINRKQKILKINGEKYDGDDYTEIDIAKLIYKHTTLNPDIEAKNTFNFGNFDFIDICKIDENFKTKQILIR